MLPVYGYPTEPRTLVNVPNNVGHFFFFLSIYSWKTLVTLLVQPQSMGSDHMISLKPMTCLRTLTILKSRAH